jgi:homoserine/homoserine lactone efflux protein
MNWQTWAAFALTETMLCFVPGPAVLFVLSQSLSHGTAKTVWSILGIVAANTVYFVLSALGVGALLLASHDLFQALKWAGVAYLFWLGVSAILGRPSAAAAAPTSVTAGNFRLLASGFVLQMSNPKALVFFTALLPQFVDTHRSIGVQMTILALTSVVIEFNVQLLYAAIAGRAARLAAQPRYARLTNRLAGAMLVLAGFGMAAIRRS